jgi:molybdenum cofactor cytidylyltransferase
VRQICGILLAAGLGRRFGGHKLLAPLATGLTIGIQSVRHLRAVLDNVVVVVRPEDTALARLLAAEPVTIVTCARADEGMGASLACGIAATREADGWLIALADMPCIDPSTIQRLVTLLQQGHDLVAPMHAGRRGHPVGFSARFGPELLGLGGDAGARVVLERHAARMYLLPVDDAGVLQDVDVPEDMVVRVSP